MLFHLLRQVVSTNAESFTFLYFLAVIVIGIVLPFSIGRMVASRIRMADYGWRIGLILMTLILPFEIMGRVWDPATGRFRIQLGGRPAGRRDPDLRGRGRGHRCHGRDKARQKKQTAEESDTSFSMSALIEALSRRINPTGTKEIVIRPYGERQVEMIIPEVDQREVDQIKKTISTAGVLQFRIVANQRRHQVLIDLATAMAKDPVAKRGRIIRDEKRQPVGLWARVGREQKVIRGVRPFRLDVSGFTVRNATTGDLLAIPPTAITGRDDDERRLQLAQYAEKEGHPRNRCADGDGRRLRRQRFPPGNGRARAMTKCMNPAIHFNLKGRGVSLFSDLTGEFSPDGQFHHQLGIVLDNELLSAPNIQERITGQGRITGKFTQEEVDFLVNILQAGSLPVVLNKNPIAEDLINPLLGSETIEQQPDCDGHFAGFWCSLVVCAYYRFSGVVACRGHAGQPAVHPGPDGADQGGPHLAGHRRPGADRRYVDRRQRADLRTHAGRDGQRFDAADGHSQRVRPGDGHDHRLELDDDDHGHRPVRDRHRPNPRLCRHVDPGHSGEHVHGDFLCPCRVRHRRTYAVPDPAEDDAVLRHAELRLPGQTVYLRGRVDRVDHHRPHRRRRTGTRACSTSTSMAALRSTCC